MNSLKSKLLAAAAIDESAWDITRHECASLELNATRVENARLLPLLTALADVASAAEGDINELKAVMPVREPSDYSSTTLALVNALERLRAQIGGSE